MLAGHGTRTLFGWFGGFGLAGTGRYLAVLGYRPGLPFAGLAGVGEAGSGVVLALGPGSPLAGMLLVATMLNVHSGHAGNGPWNSDGAWELPLPFGPIDATLGFTREATLAFDAGLRWDFRGDRWGLAAIAAGLAGGSIPLLTRRRAASGQAAESATTTA